MFNITFIYNVNNNSNLELNFVSFNIEIYAGIICLII